MIALYIVFLIFLFIFASYLALSLVLGVYSFLKGSPYVPTNYRDIVAILEKARLKRGSQFIELGSGDGRVSLYAAHKYGVVAVGYEINWLLYLRSLLGAMWQHQKQVEFKRANFFEADISGADTIYFFLFPKAIERLKSRLASKVKSGTYIISHGFAVPYFSNKLVYKRVAKPFSTYFYKV